LANMHVKTEHELEELLSRPDDDAIEAMRQLDGDLLILGAGGKMGPSLARLARRACDKGGINKRVIAVARFTNSELIAHFAADKIEAIPCDLLNRDALEKLPDIPNVVFMAARKFGTSGNEHLTWAMNTFLPGLVAERFHRSRIVAFSTGNVYPLLPTSDRGAHEATPVGPVGEYAQSALGRERMFEYGSAQWGTKAVLLRLNYAVELRYVRAASHQSRHAARQRDLARRSKRVVSAFVRTMSVAAVDLEHHGRRSALRTRYRE